MNFVTTCIGSSGHDIRAMTDSAINITRRAFLAHVDRGEQRELELSLGYEDHPSKGLTMAGDWHVSYHRSRYRGRRCYFFRWSGIEYIYAE